MAQVFVAFGSNLGDRKRLLDRACQELSGHARLKRRSSIHETAPEGEFSDTAGAFLNQALYLHCHASPEHILRWCHRIEARLGRTRPSPAETYASRRIDIDLLLYNDLVYQQNGCLIPHPRMSNRLFVLAPLREIAGALWHPTEGSSIERLYQKQTALLDKATGKELK